MGHDITAYKKSQVAYYRKNAFNPTNHRLYEVLNCKQFNGGVSGLGHSREFNKEELQEAYNKAFELGYEEEVEFLGTVLKADLQENEFLEIYFA